MERCESFHIASELLGLCVYMCDSTLLCEEFLLSSGLNLRTN
jgi:hypothetical protein